MAIKITDADIERNFKTATSTSKRDTGMPCITDNDIARHFPHTEEQQDEGPAVSLYDEKNKKENNDKNQNIEKSKSTLGAFGTGLKLGVGSFGTGMLNTLEQVKHIAQPAGEMYRATEKMMYDVNKSTQMKDVVADWNEKYSGESEYRKKLEADIIRRNEQQQEKQNKAAIKYQDAKLGEVALNTGIGVGAMLPNIAVSAVTGSPAVGTTAFAGNVFGQATAEALQSGATLDQAQKYALTDAAMEVGIEKIFGGIPMLGGGILSPKKLTSKYLKTSAGQFLANKLMDVTGEGIEEVVSGIIEPFLKRAFYDKNAENASLKDLATDFSGGALVSAILGVANVNGNIKEYRDLKNNINNQKAKNNVETSTEIAQQVNQEVENNIENEQIRLHAEENIEVLKEENINNKENLQAVPMVDDEVIFQAEKVANMQEMAKENTATQPVVDATAKKIIDKVVNSEVDEKTKISNIEKLAATMGYNLEIYDDYLDDANGINVGNKTIKVNLSSKSPIMGVLTHEIAHDYTETKNWEKYKKSLNNVIYSDRRLTTFFEDVAYEYENSDNEYIRRSVRFENGEINKKAIEDEQYLKVTEVIFDKLAQNDEKFIKEVSKDRSLMESLLDILRGIKNKISIRFTRDQKAIYDEAERQLVNMLKGTSSHGKSNRQSFSINDKFKYELKEWYNGPKDDDTTFVLGETSDVLQGLGAIEQSIYLESSKINIILQKHPEMTIYEISQIPKILDDPIIILKSKNKGRENKMNTRVVCFSTIKAKNGLPIAVVLDLSTNKNKLLIKDMQKVNSAYTKTNNAVNFLENSDVIYISDIKKRTQSSLGSIGFQMPMVLEQLGSIGSISYTKGNVNIEGVPFNEIFAKDDDQKVSATISENEKRKNKDDGISSHEYGTDNETDRFEKLNSSDDVKFSQKTEVPNLESSKTVNTEEKADNKEDEEGYFGFDVKSRAAEKMAINRFTNNLSQIMGVDYKDKNDIIKKMVWKASREANRRGYFSRKEMKKIYDKAYEIGYAIESNETKENKELKKLLRYSGVKPLGGREYTDFLLRYRGKIFFKKDGMDIDTFYKQLTEDYPEWFSKEIKNPYDQLNRIGEVYDSIKTEKVSLDDFYGNDINNFKAYSRQEFEKSLEKLVDELNNITRYKAVTYEYRNKQKAAKEAPEITIDDVNAANEKAKPLRREIARIERKALLTPPDKQVLKKLVDTKSEYIFNATVEELIADNNPQTEIIVELAKKKKELNEIQKPIYQYNIQRNARRRNMFMDILTTADGWLDKITGLGYKNSTFERNIDDVITDKKAAEQLKDIIPRSIHKHVAEATRYKNKLRNRIRKFNIDNKKIYHVNTIINNERYVADVTEVSLIQLYGEGLIDKKYLVELGADADKIEKIAIKFKAIYDELFKKINEAYVRNGYAPMDYREDYFPHFMDETGDTQLKKFAQFFGFDITNMLPTEIAGRTHEFSPGRQYNAHAKQRLGKRTDYDVIKGFDNYIEAAANIIYLTDDIQNLRAFENAIRYKYSDEGLKYEIEQIDMLEISENEKQEMIGKLYENTNRNKKLNHFVVWLHEYTNILAGKKSSLDRDNESDFGRGFYTGMKNLENRIAANMIAGNLSSAVTNFIPIAQMAAEVNPKYIITAMSDTMRNMKESDGFVDMSDFLTNRFGSEMLSLTEMQKVANWASKPMDLIDEFTSNVVVRGKYIQNINKGMNHDEAMLDANEFGRSLIADRSKGALPVIFESKNPFFKLVTMFQVEVNNQLQYLVKDLPKKSQGDVKKWLGYALFKYSFFSFMYNIMMEKLIGRKPALSPIDTLIDRTSDTTKVVKGELQASAAISNAFADIIEDLPYVSSLLAMSGIKSDVGRIPISGALPNLSELGRLFDTSVSGAKKLEMVKKELMKPVYYVAMPFGGGAVKKAVDTVDLFGNHGGVKMSTSSDGTQKVQFVVNPNPKNIAQSLISGPWSNRSAREYVESGFKGMTKVQTQAFLSLKKTGLQNSEAWGIVFETNKADLNKNGRVDKEEAKRYLNKKRYSREQKAILFEMLCPNVKENPYK